MSNEQKQPQEGRPLTAEEIQYRDTHRDIMIDLHHQEMKHDGGVLSFRKGFDEGYLLAVRGKNQALADHVKATATLREELERWETAYKHCNETSEARLKNNDRLRGEIGRLQTSKQEWADLAFKRKEELEAVKKERVEWINEGQKVMLQRDEVTRQRDEAVELLEAVEQEEASWKKERHEFLSRLSSGETKPVSPVGSNTLNVLAVLSTLSPARSKAAFGLGVDEWSLPEWACALAGEVGELCNFIKKTNRDGLDRTEDIAKEAADVAIYLDLLCTRAGIDLQAAIVSKFNEVSDRMNCDIKFPAPPESLTDKK